MTKGIPYGRQSITSQDIEAVTRVLTSDFLTQGPAVAAFEEAFAGYIGCKYAVAVANGTAALHLATLALGVTSGTKVITTPVTFAASANCVLYAGGEVTFSDMDEHTFTLDIQKLEKLLQQYPVGTFSGIIPVDLAGYPVNTEAIRKIADKYGLWILEDACHAPGGWFTNSDGQKVHCGDGSYCDAAIFSFHPVKHIATGEGGMITTNRKDVYEKLLLLRTHGITKDPSLMTENHGGWYYEMQTLGFNYRLSDIQAALGLSQLSRADEGLAARNRIASTYHQAFAEHKNILLPAASGESMLHAYHLYIIRVRNRKELYDYLRSLNIFTQVHYIPVHLLPYYKNKGWKKGDFPVAENYYEQCLSLPMYPTLTGEEQHYVIEKVLEFLS